MMTIRRCTCWMRIKFSLFRSIILLSFDDFSFFIHGKKFVVLLTSARSGWFHQFCMTAWWILTKDNRQTEIDAIIKVSSNWNSQSSSVFQFSFRQANFPCQYFLKEENFAFTTWEVFELKRKLKFHKASELSQKLLLPKCWRKIFFLANAVA